MTVNITDPPDQGTFPDGPNGWTAIATIDSLNAVDGTLLDLDNPNEVYQSNNTTGTGPVGGIWTWQVPFTPDTNIKSGDPLMIYCYDGEISGDGNTSFDTASTAGLAGSPNAGRQKAAGLFAGTPSIDITAASLSGTTVPVTVKLTPQTKGGIFLVLVNYTGNIKKITKSVQVHRLAASEKETRNHTFQEIDAGKWTHIFVIAVTYRHRGKPKVKALKTPHK